MTKTTVVDSPTALKQLEDLGERLRLARHRRKITSTLFAERMGVSRETLRRLEMGTRLSQSARISGHYSC
jgi:DNA-binding XRE family transcriptional regulator